MSGVADLFPVRPLSPTAGTPLYEQVAAQLRSLLAEGKWEEGDRIPPERILVDEFGVSRITLRRAVDALVDEHLLVRRSGAGTFVASVTSQLPLVGLHSTRDIARAHGLRLEVRILGYQIRRASRLEGSKLELRAGKPVVSFVRQDWVGEEPICVAQCVLPARLAGPLSEPALVAYSTYELIERDLNIRIVKARQRVYADAAPTELAPLLGIEAGAPLMRIDRVTLDAHDIPVEWGLISYPHQEIECVTELLRESNNRRESVIGFALRFRGGSMGGGQE